MNTRTKSCIAVLAGMLVWPLGSLAAASDASDASSESGLQEIVVTAERRAEDLDKVPISIAAFDRDQLDRQGVRDIEDLYQMTPGVDFQQQGELVHLSIRGISSTAGSATAGIYINDVPIQTRFPYLNLIGSPFPGVFDLDRVEVLRGPQGTYFGAGAEAGAILFITAQPSVTQASGYTREGFNAIDNGGLGYEAGVAYGAPIVPNEVGYRVSASYERTGGYVDAYSTIPGGVTQADSNWSETAQVNAAVLFQPNEHIKVTPQIFFQSIDTHNLSSFDPNLSDPANNTYVNGTLLGQPSRNTLYVPQLKAEFDLGEVSLTSISGYVHRDDTYGFDYTALLPEALALPVPTNPDYYTMSAYEVLQENVSQELRLQNTDPNARLKWLVGAWFSLARQEDVQGDIAPGFNQYLLQYTGKDILQTFGCCGSTGLLPGGISNLGTNFTHDRQIAGFGQIDWEIINHLTLTLGLRYAKQSNDFSLAFDGALNGGATLSSGSESQNVTTPKYGISYQIDDKNMVYATASKGNRLGGGNAPFFIFPGCLAQLAELGLSRNPTGYDSDYVWNYELGSKNLLLNDRLQIEASIYHMDWTNLQQNIYVPACATGFTANIGKATSNGFDLQVNAKPSDSLTLSLLVGYDKAVAAETTGIPNGAVFVNNGDQIDPTQSPWNVTGVVEYNFKIFGDQASYLRLDDEYHSKNPGPFTFQNPDAASYNPNLPINESQNLLNFRLGTITHGWDVALFAKNVLNDHPLLNVTPLTSLAPVGHDYTLTPRTVGVVGSYSW